MVGHGDWTRENAYFTKDNINHLAKNGEVTLEFNSGVTVSDIINANVNYYSMGRGVLVDNIR